MTSGQRLILYTREGCHLCEQVSAMLAGAGLAWEPVDIDRTPGLDDRYGLRIPVIRDAASGSELDYPFTREQLLRFAARVAGAGIQ